MLMLLINRRKKILSKYKTGGTYQIQFDHVFYFFVALFINKQQDVLQVCKLYYANEEWIYQMGVGVGAECVVYGDNNACCLDWKWFGEMKKSVNSPGNRNGLKRSGLENPKAFGLRQLLKGCWNEGLSGTENDLRLLRKEMRKAHFTFRWLWRFCSGGSNGPAQFFQTGPVQISSQTRLLKKKSARQRVKSIWTQYSTCSR